MALFRLPIAFVLAVALTGGVFWFLWALIRVPFDITQLGPAVKIEFTPLRRDTEVQTKREEKAQRERPTQAPIMPQMASTSFGMTSDSVQMINPVLDTRGSLSGLSVSAGGSDRDVIPLVRINPDYPQRALARGIEGWVLVEFTISPAGTVKDAKVIDADPKGTFEDSALKAIARWKYNPKVEGGVAVERRGIRTVIRFVLEK